MDLGVVLFYEPIFNLLVVFYRLFGGDLALAIIAIAFLSRLLTFPLTMRQIKMAETSQDFNAKVKEIRKKHKDDQEKQTQELMKVQSEYLPGQLSGCVGMIVQLVILVNIFNVIRNLVADGVASFNTVAYPFVPMFEETVEINKNFLGIINLGTTASAVGFDDIGIVLPYILLAIAVGATQFFSARILMGLRKKRQPVKVEKEKKSKKKKKKDAEVEPEDFAEIMQRSTQQTMFIIPFLLFFSALNFPAALGIYWTVQSGFVIIQQLVIDYLVNRNDNSSSN